MKPEIKITGEGLPKLEIDKAKNSIIVVFGKVGVGKSTIANELASRLGASVLSSDYFRRKRFGGMQYQTWHSELALVDMLIQGRRMLVELGKTSFVLDATFSEAENRIKVSKFAQACRKEIVWVEVVNSNRPLSNGNIDGELVKREQGDIREPGLKVVIDNSLKSQYPLTRAKDLIDRIFT